MSAARGPIAAYRRYWLPELVVLAALATAATILFAVTDLDVAAARMFYRPEAPNPWPVANQPLWNLFYRSAPWVTASLAVAGTGLILAGSIREASGRLRVYGFFVLLCVVIGPGLIVNGVLKDHWGRPRPREIVEFGGRLPYAPPLLPAGSHGKSFPCGHCSVGFLYGTGWWLRRRRPAVATLSLAAGAAAGSLLGVGRMAAGGHFLSDIVWSGLIAWGVAHVLYYYVLRIPAREDSRASLYPGLGRGTRARRATLAAAIFLGAGIVLGGLLASPSDRDLSASPRLSGFPAAPETLEVLADTLDVEIRLVAGVGTQIACTGSVHGFGLPTNDIADRWEYEERPRPLLRYRVVEKGTFTDIDGVARLGVPVGTIRRIVVRVARGNIVATDDTGGAAAAGSLPDLDLRTGSGLVRRPATPGGAGKR